MSIAQRSDFTFKHNRNLGRHGWLRLTPAYSVKLVHSLLNKTNKDVLVFDPFSGTATTGLVAAEHGNHAITLDINPFLIWLGNTKCRNYDKKSLENLRKRIARLILKLPAESKKTAWTPPIFNIERWWSNGTLKTLAALRVLLEKEIGRVDDSEVGSLAWVAFCRLIIETSSAAFNHVSMSFSKTATHFNVKYIAKLYLEILDFILLSSGPQIPGTVRILNADARDIPDLGQKIGMVITSPPYPNRISYIRELRPYMYWTKFIAEAKEAGEMDWLAIGGTWGIATSRLNTWESQQPKLPLILHKAVKAIARTNSKNAEILSVYVLKYFHDLHLHLESLRERLADGAKINYIVGNSSFYGNMVDTSAIMSASMKNLGYKNVKSEVIRKRNCNKALFEYNVSAVWK